MYVSVPEGWGWARGRGRKRLRLVRQERGEWVAEMDEHAGRVKGDKGKQFSRGQVGARARLIYPRNGDCNRSNNEETTSEADSETSDSATASFLGSGNMLQSSCA